MSDFYALDVALIPVDHPVPTEANRILLKGHPLGFPFDADHLPHITLLQQYMSSAALPSLTRNLATALARAGFPQRYGQMTVTGLSRSPGEAPRLVLGDDDGRLQQLHEAVLQACLPFREAVPASAESQAFADRPGDRACAYVRGFAEEQGGAAFRPHLTLGIGPGGLLRDLEEKTTFPFTLDTARLVVARLGPHCTVSREIHAEFTVAGNAGDPD